jgi:uncharacterized membrane protein YgaE (UPF0421/DUF939 family)
MSEYTKKLLERIARTALVAFLAPVTAALLSDSLTIDVAQSAAIAALAAVGTLILGLLSKNIGPEGTPGVV